MSNSDAIAPPDPAEETQVTSHSLLDGKVARFPDDLAYRFLADGETDERLITYGELAKRARGTAAVLQEHGCEGQPVLLACLPGLEFIEGLFACWYAGAIAVPIYPPRGSRHKKRLLAVAAACGARVALAATEGELVPGVRSLVPGGSIESENTGHFPEIDPQAPCLLQYTSGSTAEPKGVMISHANLRGHFASMAAREDFKCHSPVSWLPPYHDMGLVLKILYAFELGVPLTFFSPEHFIQKPLRWLQAISRYRADMSGGPNFAYELCLRTIRDEDLATLDLSCWKSAVCGAERVRADTLKRFADRFAACGFKPESFLPGYGLAETTLIVTAVDLGEAPRISNHPEAGRLVSNGKPLPGVQLRIVDPASGSELKAGQIGEIRIRGAAVSRGYWPPTGEIVTELHTGDLGYLERGELYVTGRIKDLIIIDGTNHAPEDIESEILNDVPEVTAAAAFSIEANGKESVVIVAETERSANETLATLHAKVRRAAGEALGVPVHRVLLVRTGLIPRTTSGKVRRAASRESFLEGSLKFLFDDDSFSAPQSADEPARLLLEIIREVSGNDTARPDDDLIDLGLSSMDMTRLAAQLHERTGAAISVGDLFAARSVAEVAAMIPQRLSGRPVLSGIVAGSGIDTNVMTHSQERMWFLHQLDPDSTAYHVFGALELSGQLDTSAMDRAIQHTVLRHDILCSRHGNDQGHARVRVERNTGIPILHQYAANEQALQQELTRFARKPFSLAHEPAIRAGLVSCGANRHILAICAHHIVADGWSMRILASEIAATYAAFRAGQEPDIPLPRHTYLDYALHHRRWVDSGAVDSQVAYWKARLAGHPGVLQLATDFARPAATSSDGGSIERTLPHVLCRQVAKLARTHRGTPFMVHLAALLLLLRRHGAGDDAVIAVPVANRNHAVAADIIGTLVNTLPFRLPLDPGERFSDLLDRVREASFEMQANQDAPFEKIIDAVKPDRSRDHSPLAQVMFDHQEIPISGTWAGELDCKPFMAHRGSVQFDLSLLLTVIGDRQQLSLEYRTDLFLAETATAMLDRYIGILTTICGEPDTPLVEITALTRTDEERLERLSEGAVQPDFPTRTTPALIAARAAAHPDRAAIHDPAQTLDYATVEQRSSSLARHLQLRGVKAGDRVAILLERDADLPVALLGVWKAGAAYVPLDSANPPERLKLVLDDQHPVHVLASLTLAHLLPDNLPAILSDESLFTETDTGIFPAPAPGDTAYVIYTSGSTGRPKGVVVSHGALANFLRSMAGTPGFTEADRLLAVTTVSFDISTLEMFLPLTTGGSLDLVTTETARDGAALLKRMKATSPTVMQATPATWRLLIDAGWRGSRDLKILCGGEALDLPLASQLASMGCQLWNMYGPTETTVWSTLWRVPENPAAIRIGLPIANTGIHILATDGSPLPPGVSGELWISGEGLADGYWQRPDLTDRSFVTPAAGPRRYNTGDIARWAADGTLECLGRSDGQVKIRGFRVELGEIEAALASHPGIAQAKVALRGQDASKKLVAWVTPHPGQEAPDMTGFRHFLTGLLPAYMLPADIGIIGSFPLNPNGKVDVSRLSNPEPVTVDNGPMTPTELRLASIWSELLEKGSVHQQDDWFHSGGHSLLALRLFARIRSDFRRTLPLSTILEHSTLEQLAAVIDNTPETAA
ncbi:MAG: amino acid adenylation domain-containing protein [Verrucomicrobiaceae bacterium]|nr:MAG: amino acid adenylation domain-containing protein [Verrucomicrobiaceae bacterium]